MSSGPGTRANAKGALRGIRVLEFGQYIPGPMLGMLLCDQGAEVIKVERPGGDPARSMPAFATWNRGKRSIVLDLKSEVSRAKAEDLARASDVLIENFRPGVADRLGIGYDRLSRLNPRLVYCSLPGFGEESPYRDSPGWEPLVAANTGLYPEGEHGPHFTPLPAASTFGAIIGATSVAFALIARHKSGAGQHIEVPLYSAMFAAMGRRLINMHEGEPFDLFTLPRLIMNHQYECADGRWVQNHGMFERFFRRFLPVAGHPEWTEELVGLLGNHLDPEIGQMWLHRFEEVFRQRTAQEWEDAISAAGGACTVCKTTDEWLEHDHARASGMVVEVEDATLGPMKQPGVQVQLRGTTGAIRGSAPLLGEHTEEVLQELREGGDSQVGSPAQQNAMISALEGVRVLDLCLILAGPTCGRTLAEFGADVIKIDDPARPYDITGNLDVNRGKRSILLDLKTEAGLEVFWRLVETADVVVENNRKGGMDRLGLGYEHLKARRPDIIYASLNTYGYDGPWSERAGWEQLAQATSGIQVRHGGAGAPTTLLYTVNDYGTGVLGAYAVALALHEHDNTGMGQPVSTALSFTAGLVQSPYFLSYQGLVRKEPEGREAWGFSALSRLYPASDGWLYLHCPDEAGWQGLTGLEELAHLAADRRFATAQGRAAHGEELAGELGRIFRLKTRSEWIKPLNSASVCAVENVAIPEFRDDPHVRRAGLVVTREHGDLGRVDHLGTTARLSGTPMRLGRPSPVLGAETEEILREAGYSRQEIEALKSARAVVQT